MGSRWFKGIHWHRTPRQRKCGNQFDTPKEADSINILNLILFFSFCVTNAHLHFYDWCCQDAYFPRLEYGNLCVPKWYPKSCFGILSTIGLQHLATTGKGGQAPNALGDCGVPYPWPCSECRCEWLIWLIRGFESFWVDYQVALRFHFFLTWPSLWYRSVFVCLMRSRYVNNTRNCFNEALMQDVVSMVRGHRTTPTVSLDSQYLPSRTLFASRWGRTFSEPCRHGTRRYVSMSHYFALIHSQEICVAETSLHHALMCIDAEQDPLAFSDPEDVRSQVEWTWQCMAVADCPWASWAPCEFDSVHVFIKDEPSLERAWPHLLKPQLHRQSRKKNHQFRSQ